MGFPSFAENPRLWLVTIPVRLAVLMLALGIGGVALVCLGVLSPVMYLRRRMK